MVAVNTDKNLMKNNKKHAGMLKKSKKANKIPQPAPEESESDSEDELEAPTPKQAQVPKKASKKPEPVQEESESDSEEESDAPIIEAQKTKKTIPQSELSKNSKKVKSEESESDDDDIDEEDDSDDDNEEEDDSDVGKVDSSDVVLENGESADFSEDDNESPVFVMLGNLSSRTSIGDMKDLLSCSNVQYSKLNKKGRTATLTVMAGSLSALLNLIGTPIKGRKLSVLVPEEVIPKNVAPSGEENPSVFVKNLDYSTTNDSLQEAFEGSVSARVITDRETGRSKGFGYVDFSTIDEARHAMESVTSVDGRNVFTDFAAARGTGGTPRGGRSFEGRGGFRGDSRGGRGGFRGGNGFRGERGGFRGNSRGSFRGRGQPKHMTYDD